MPDARPPTPSERSAFACPDCLKPIPCGCNIGDRPKSAADSPDVMGDAFRSARRRGRPVGQAAVEAVVVDQISKAEALEAENEKLRALVTRLTDVAENLAGELFDPGAEALAAIYCGRNFVYG